MNVRLFGNWVLYIISVVERKKDFFLWSGLLCGDAVTGGARSHHEDADAGAAVGSEGHKCAGLCP